MRSSARRPRAARRSSPSRRTRRPAEVFLSQREALELAFPDADRIEKKSTVLDDAQAAAVEKHSGAPLETKLVTLHAGLPRRELLGYALIDVHTVRTLPEAFLVVLTPDGARREPAHARLLRALRVQAAERFLAQFDARASSRSCASAAPSTASRAPRSRRAP